MKASVSRRPDAAELISDYHRNLIEKLDGDCVLGVMADQMHWLCELASHLSTEQVDRIHPPFGWTIRQVFEHCADAERVFGYRMLRIAAGDRTPLPGWDENAYAESRFGLGNFTNLVNEIAALRQANLGLLRRIVPRAWDNTAEVAGIQVSVRVVAWLAAAHLSHHFEIVQHRCGLTVPRAANH